MLAAVPIGIFVALVLLANNIRDIAYDGSVGERTVAVVLGASGAKRLYTWLLEGAYLLVLAGMLVQQLPVWSFLVFLTSPGALRLVRMFKGAIPDNADPQTAALAFQFALMYMASLVLFILLPVKLPI
jgi:1,4-dihydroxy-2-naphthoate octaprenyltransferase